MRVITYILIMCILGCNSLTTDISGTWAVYKVGSGESSSSALNYLFMDDRAIPLIYINERTIEYPFGFCGLNSLEFEENFIDYTYDGKLLKMLNNEFEVQSITADSICMWENNEILMCLKKVYQRTDDSEIDKIRFTSKDEYFNIEINIYSDGSFLLKRTNGLSDTITGLLSKDDFDYLQNLVERTNFLKLKQEYNPTASDLPNYLVEIAFRDGSVKNVVSNGYRPLPDIPYSLSVLIYNLDKLTRRDYF